MIRTVTGDLDAIEGRVLAHEHLRLDLSAQKNPSVVLGPEEEEDVVADLVAAKNQGLALVADLSVPGSGRDLTALARISGKADLPVVAATGFYWDPYPAPVPLADPEALADRMRVEIEEGDAQGHRCGVVKVGTPRGVPDETAGRLFRAAAAAARTTGAALIAHTSSPEQAEWQIATLRQAGLEPERTLISHFGKAPFETLEAAGRAGVFIGIDQIGFDSGPSYASLAALVAKACAIGLESQLILSSDVARRTRLRRMGGTSYGTVFTHFVPELQKAGLKDRLIEELLHANPVRLLTLTPI